ncbi:MAG: hypothetical protein Q8O49_00115 [bacterium]|nr:hypothetical protein [bacterium]
MLKKYWKIIIIAFFVIALTVAGYSIKKYFDAKNTPINQEPGTAINPTSTSTLISENGDKAVLKKISEQPVFDFFATGSSTNEIIYVTPSGEVYQANEGNDDQLSKQTFNAINSIAASPSRQKILAAFGDPNQPQWLIFDLIDKTWRPLSNTVKRAVWGNNDDEIIALNQQNGSEDLIKLKTDQNPFAQEMLWRNFSFQDINLIFVAPQTIIISEKPMFSHQSRAWEFNTKTSEINLVFGPVNGLLLSQTADRSLVMKFDNTNYLSIISPTQTASYQTLPEKCENAAEGIYCFLPISWPEENNWPDDYFQKRLYTEDQLFIFNNEGNKIFNLDENEKIDGLKPTVVNNSLYFLNRRDSSLYQLSSLNTAITTPTAY